jgi:hypothetical protein
MICTSCDLGLNNTLNETKATPLVSSLAPDSESFDDSSHGWPEFSSDIYSISISQGLYLLELMESNQTIWAVSPNEIVGSESTSSIDLFFGAGDGFAGTLCNQSSDGFYAFTISPEGHYVISRYFSDGKKTVLASGSHVTISPDSNYLVSQCTGGSLTLFVNGHYVASAYDNVFLTGHSGVILESKDSDFTSVSFDNFLVELPLVSEEN